MRNILLVNFLFLIMIALISCSSIKVKHDSFKNATIVTMELDHDIDIDDYNKDAVSHGTMYSREIKDGVKGKVEVLFNFIGSPDLNALTSEGFIKIDNKTYKLVITGIASDIQSGTQTSKSLNHKTGKLEDETVSFSMNVLKGKTIFSEDIEKALLNANSVVYRLYSHKIPLDIKVSRSELNEIKKFLAIDSTNK